MALVQFVNDSAPYLNAENLNNNFSELAKIGNSAVFCKTNSQSMQDNTLTVVQLNRTDIASDYFELLNDGTIKVLKDISKVLVTMNIRVSNTVSNAGGYVYARVNGVAGTGLISTVSYPMTVATGSGVLNVQKNDVITIQAYVWSGSGSANSNGIDGYDRDWAGISLIVLG